MSSLTAMVCLFAMLTVPMVTITILHPFPPTSIIITVLRPVLLLILNPVLKTGVLILPTLPMNLVVKTVAIIQMGGWSTGRERLYQITAEGSKIILGNGVSYCSYDNYSSDPKFCDRVTAAGSGIGYYRLSVRFATSSSCSAFSHNYSDLHVTPCTGFDRVSSATCPRSWGVSALKAYPSLDCLRVDEYAIPSHLSLSSPPRYCLAGTYYPPA